jgi:enoyl-CoA hydratase/carnithine racemase
MADRQYIKLTIEDKVALLTIDHPPVNALSSTVFAELDDALNEITGNPDVRALVITGTGAAFVAGADIREFTQLQSGSDAAARIRENMKVINRIDELPIPVIAAVNG